MRAPPDGASGSSSSPVSGPELSPTVTNRFKSSGVPRTSETWRYADFSSPILTKAACIPGSTRSTRPL